MASGYELHLAAGRKTAYSGAARLRDVKVSGIIESQIDRLVELRLNGVDRPGARSLHTASCDNFRIVLQQMERKDIRRTAVDDRRHAHVCIVVAELRNYDTQLVRSRRNDLSDALSEIDFVVGSSRIEAVSGNGQRVASLCPGRGEFREPHSGILKFPWFG